MDENEQFDKFLADIQANTKQIYFVAGIDYTPENLNISDKIFKELIATYQNDLHYPYKKRDRYPDFIRWLKWHTEKEAVKEAKEKNVS